MNNGVDLHDDFAELNTVDSPSSGQSSICSIPGSPVSHRSGRALRREGQRDLHSSSFSVASEYFSGNDQCGAFTKKWSNDGAGYLIFRRQRGR